MDIHQCQCPTCQQEAAHPDQALHRQMNLVLSRLDEQQRRWYDRLLRTGRRRGIHGWGARWRAIPEIGPYEPMIAATPPPNLRLKLTARAPTLGCGRLGRRSLGAPR